MNALLAALPAGVACVTFLIGFANLRIHAERQRAIQRADEIAREITHASGKEAIQDEDVEATSTSFSEAMHIDPVATWTLYAASFVSLICILLFSAQVANQHWSVNFDPASWADSFLPLLSMPVFSVVVTSLGWADYSWVIRDLSRRRSESFMETVRNAISLRREGKFSEALARLEPLTPKLDRWAWLFAFRSNCLEHLGNYAEATRLARMASALSPQNGWYILQIARLLWEQDQPRQALELADQAVTILPDEPSARGLRGIILDRLGEDEKALQDLEIALRNSPTDVELIRARSTSLIRSNVGDLSVRTIEQIIGENDEIFIAALRARAHTRLKKRDLEQAIKDLDGVISASESDSEAIAYRALAFSLLGDKDSAQKDISSYEALPSTTTLAGVVEIGQSLFRLARYDDALIKFSDYLQVHPNSRVALHWRGMVYEELGQVTKAIEDYEHRLQKDPKDIHFLVHHGSLMMDVGLRDSALRDLNEAVALSETNRYARGTRGSILMSLKKYEEAFEDFDYLARTDPDDVFSLVRRASVYLQLEKLQEALADLSSAERIDAEYARIYGVRGIILRIQEKLDEALRDLDRAIQLAPDDVIALANRAAVNDKLSRPQEAISDYSNAIRLSPSDATFHVQRGCVYFRSGAKLDAIRDYNKALSIAPSNVQVLLHRSEWYLDDGQSQEAIADLMRAHAEDSENLSVLERLTLAWKQAGDLDKARIYGAKAIEILKKARDEKPEDLSVLDGLAFIYAKTGDSENAGIVANQIASSVFGQDGRVRQIAYRWNNRGLPVESSILFKALADTDPSNVRDGLAYAISVCQANEVAEARRLFGELLSTDEAGATAAWDSLVIPSLLYKYEEVAACWDDALAHAR